MTRLRVNASAPGRRVKRRHYEQAFKRHLVELTLVPGASVARIALDHRINANILFRWRRQYLRDLGAAAAKPAAALLPVALSDAEQALEVINAGTPSARTPRMRKRVLGPSAVIEIELAGAQVRVTGDVALEALRLVLETLSQR